MSRKLYMIFIFLFGVLNPILLVILRILAKSSGYELHHYYLSRLEPFLYPTNIYFSDMLRFFIRNVSNDMSAFWIVASISIILNGLLYVFIGYFIWEVVKRIRKN